MLNEFYLFKKNNIFYIIILMASIFLIILSYNYYFSIENSVKDNWLTNIGEYETKEDLNALLSQINDEIESLDQNSNKYIENLSNLNKIKNIYLYLLNTNFVPYDDIIEYEYINNSTNSSLNYTNRIITISMFITIIASIFLTIGSINLDYLYGTSKYVYTKDKNRLITLINKYILHLIIVSILFLFLFLLGLLFGFDYHQGAQHIIITNGNVNMISSSSYLFVSFVSNFINTLLLASIVFFIAVITKNIFISFIVNFVFYSVFFIILPIVEAMYFMHKPYIFHLFDSFADNLFKYNSIVTAIIVFFVELFIMFVLGYCAIMIMKKRDIA